MKKIKISFLAIIALLAMSFTVATHEGGFKTASKKSKQVFVCQPDQGQGLYFRAFASCLTGMMYQQGASPCPPAGHFGLDCARPSTLVPNQAPVQCPGGARFCCAVIVPQQPNCPTGCRTVQVFCRP